MMVNSAQGRAQVERSKIVQLVPAASGWRAVYVSPRFMGADLLMTTDVASWALIEDHEGNQEIVGICGPYELETTQATNLLGYAGPGQSLELFLPAALAMRETDEYLNADQNPDGPDAMERGGGVVDVADPEESTSQDGGGDEPEPVSVHRLSVW